eukprot:870903-Prymnesium_polylepis.1
MASEALWGTALVWRSEGCSCELFEPKYALRPPVSMRVTSRRSSGLLTIAKNRGGAAEPVAGGQPVSIVQNISGDLLDGGAELHHLIGDVDDRAGSLDDDEQRAGGALGGATRAKPPTPRAFGGHGQQWQPLQIKFAATSTFAAARSAAAHSAPRLHTILKGNMVRSSNL